jgi:lactam utilization protein B
MKNLTIITATVAAAWLWTGSAVAMPVEQDWYDEKGVTEDGRLDIREIDDSSSDMEMRLSRQVMVLQRQIDVLRREIGRLNAEVESLK